MQSPSKHLTLDAVLPIVIALCPFGVRLIVPRGHMLEVAVMIVAPVLAAFLRATIGILQLDAVTDGKPTFGRQFLFALAIMVLFLTEVFVSTLQFAQNEPLTAWCYPAGMFCIYLVLIQKALRENAQGTIGVQYTTYSHRAE